MNLLKASEAKDNKTEQLKAIRKLLVYFRDYDNMQKDKILTLLDNMIENKDCSGRPAWFFVFEVFKGRS